jgi:hypothetical protein
MWMSTPSAAAASRITQNAFAVSFSTGSPSTVTTVISNGLPAS